MTKNTPSPADLIRQRATEMMEDRDGDLALADAMLTVLAEYDALRTQLPEFGITK